MTTHPAPELTPPMTEVSEEAERLCSDCPPTWYPTDKTRCLPCPRRANPALAEIPEAAIDKFDAEFARIMAMSDDEIIAEVIADGEDPATVSASARREFELVVERIASARVAAEHRAALIFVREREELRAALALSHAEIAGLRMEVEALRDERDRLREALIASGRAAGAFLTDQVSTDFLMLIPAEIEAKISILANGGKIDNAPATVVGDLGDKGKLVEAVINWVSECEGLPDDPSDAELLKAVWRYGGDLTEPCPECDGECGEPCAPVTAECACRALDRFSEGWRKKRGLIQGITEAALITPAQTEDAS